MPQLTRRWPQLHVVLLLIFLLLALLWGLWRGIEDRLWFSGVLSGLSALVYVAMYAAVADVYLWLRRRFKAPTPPQSQAAVAEDDHPSSPSVPS